MDNANQKQRTAILGLATCAACILASSAAAGADAAATGTAATPLAESGNTKVLWIESDRVQPAWQGEDLARVTDEQTGAACLEWHQDPALRGKATLALPGVDISSYDALRFQWKYIGGGSLLQVQLGKLNWYLNKQPYKPGQWQDAWLDLSLDDDAIGTSTNAQGQAVLTLIFANEPLNRADEQLWRRIRIADVRLVKFPVRLGCDPKAVQSRGDAASLTTAYPLLLTNTTAASQTVRLSLDPLCLREFTPSFETNRLTLPPHAARTVRLEFSIPRARAASLPSSMKMANRSA